MPAGAETERAGEVGEEEREAGGRKIGRMNSLASSLLDDCRDLRPLGRLCCG